MGVLRDLVVQKQQNENNLLLKKYDAYKSILDSNDPAVGPDQKEYALSQMINLTGTDKKRAAAITPIFRTLLGISNGGGQSMNGSGGGVADSMGMGMGMPSQVLYGANIPKSPVTEALDDGSAQTPSLEIQPQQPAPQPQLQQRPQPQPQPQSQPQPPRFFMSDTDRRDRLAAENVAATNRNIQSGNMQLDAQLKRYQTAYEEIRRNNPEMSEEMATAYAQSAAGFKIPSGAYSAAARLSQPASVVRTLPMQQNGKWGSLLVKSDGTSEFKETGVVPTGNQKHVIRAEYVTVNGKQVQQLYYSDGTKEEVAGVSKQATAGGAGSSRTLTPEQAAAIGDAIINGMQPPMMTGMYSGTGAVRAYLASKGFDLEQAQRDWQAVGANIRTLNGVQIRRQINAIDTMIELLPQVQEAFDRWKENGWKFGIRTFDRATLKTAIEMGSADASEVNRLITDLTADIASIYKMGNAATDESLDIAKANLGAEWSEDQFYRAVENLTKFGKIRKNSIQTSAPLGIQGDTYLTPEQKARRQQDAAGAATVASPQQPSASKSPAPSTTPAGSSTAAAPAPAPAPAAVALPKPRQPNQLISTAEAYKYLEANKGDKRKAMEQAKADGWRVQ